MVQQRGSRAFLSQGHEAGAGPIQEFELHLFIVGCTRLRSLLNPPGKRKRIVGEDRHARDSVSDGDRMTLASAAQGPSVLATRISVLLPVSRGWRPGLGSLTPFVPRFVVGWANACT